MIECIQRTDIRECPGLMWKDCEMLYVLPLIKDSRIYNWPLVSVPIILYEKRISPDIDSEYMNVGMSDISAEFEELFPEYPYGKDGVYTGKFILPVGIEVTNTSGKALFDMIPVEFHVVDNITQSACYVEEIKQLYQKYILRENHIISYEEYAKEREKLLHKYKMREKNDEKYQEQIESAGKLKLL